MRISMRLLRHLTTLLLLALALPAAAEPETLAIVEVDNAGGASADDASSVSDALVSAFVNDARLKLVERQELRRVMREQALAQSGAVGDDVQIKVGKLFGARWVATVKVGIAPGGYKVAMHVLETNTGVIAAAEEVRLASASQLEAGAKKLALKVADKLAGGSRAGSASAGVDYDPAQVGEAGHGLSQLLARRFPPLEGKIAEALPNGTASCQLPNAGGFEGQRFEIVGYDEVTEQYQRKGLFLLTAYDGSVCSGRLKVEHGMPVEDRDKLKSLPIKISLDPLATGNGAEGEMAKVLFDETKANLKLIPQFELTSGEEAQLTANARISGPRGHRNIQVQVLNAKSGSVIRQLDLVGTF
jgi:hypothetical protein